MYTNFIRNQLPAGELRPGGRDRPKITNRGGRRVTKERLRQYRDIKKELNQIKQKVEALEAALYSPKAQKLTGTPASTAGSDHREALIDRHTELLDHYREKAAELAGEQLAVETAIEALDPTSRMLLRHRYIDGLTWEEVCVQLSYSWRQIHNIHGRALEKLKTEEEKEPSA